MIAHGVVAVPGRLDAARRLAGELGAEVLSVDQCYAGERANHQKVLAWLADTDADWLTMVEDDAILCHGFLDLEAQRLAECDGSQVVSWYLGTGRGAGQGADRHPHVVAGLVEAADRWRDDWIVTDELWHAVAVSITGPMAPSILHDLARTPAPTDLAISNWCRHHHVPVWYSHPSLADHRDEGRAEQSNDRPVPRHAWRFADESGADQAVVEGRR